MHRTAMYLLLAALPISMTLLPVGLATGAQPALTDPASGDEPEVDESADGDAGEESADDAEEAAAPRMEVTYEALAGLSEADDAVSGPDAPFSADDIRAATSNGRSYLVDSVSRRMGRDGEMMEQSVRFRVSFSRVTDDGCWLSSARVNDDGTETSAGGNMMTWASLASHGEHPRETTVRARRTVELMGAERTVWVYVTTAGEGMIRANLFDPEIPGMPLLSLVMNGDGEELNRTAVVEFEPGGDDQ